jgi:hypothetical protein
MHDMSLKPESLSCSQQISSFDFASRATRIEEDTDYFLWSEKVRKHFHPFWTNLNGDIADAGQVTSRPAETIDKPELNWVNANIEHDGNTSRRGLCSRSSRTADRYNQVYWAPDQFGGKFWKALVAALGRRP